jgi:hypothetical protein
VAFRVNKPKARKGFVEQSPDLGTLSSMCRLPGQFLLAAPRFECNQGLLDLLGGRLLSV